LDPTQRLRDLAVSESGFVFDPYSGQTYSLNATGRVLLEALKGGAGPAELEQVLRQRFEVAGGDDLQRDVGEFLRTAREQGWPVPGPEGT